VEPQKRPIALRKRRRVERSVQRPVATFLQLLNSAPNAEFGKVLSEYAAIQELTATGCQHVSSRMTTLRPSVETSQKLPRARPPTSTDRALPAHVAIVKVNTSRQIAGDISRLGLAKGSRLIGRRGFQGAVDDNGVERRFTRFQLQPNLLKGVAERRGRTGVQQILGFRREVRAPQDSGAEHHGLVILRSATDGKTGADPKARPDPEVVAQAKRRRFTAAYKQRILTESDQAKGSGGIGALLRREGLYSPLLATWRRERAASVLQALTPQKRGPKSKRDPLQEETSKLRRENERLTEQLRKAEIVIDVQKKVAALLGWPIATPGPEEKS
jgi:transposase